MKGSRRLHLRGIRDNQLHRPVALGTTFEQVATGAAIVGTAVFVIGFCLSFLLPSPKAETAE